MAWWKRKQEVVQAGSVLFRGRWPARLEDFAFLQKQGITLRPLPGGSASGWKAQLEHPTWGAATLAWTPDAPLPSRQLIDWEPRLTPEEKALAQQVGSLLGVTAEPQTGNVLADRKHLLRYLHAVMGADGLGVMDHAAQSFWSREGLDDELAHDAELDIESIFSLHALSEQDMAEAQEGDAPDEEEPRRAYWLHSHGLAEIGFADFDLLDPSPDLNGHASDVLRALAFAVVEGHLAVGAEPFELLKDLRVCGVEARTYHATAPASRHAAWREAVDAEHLQGHVLVCEPGRPGLWARLRGQQVPPRPARFLQGDIPDQILIQFSHEATELMTRRASQTLTRLRTVHEELRELELPTLVKLGYAVDGASGSDEREHLWFEVHGFSGSHVEATLLNQPFHIARLEQGQRGKHALELLSDWTIMTPVGRISPRESRALRFIRKNREAFTALVAELRAAGG